VRSVLVLLAVPAVLVGCGTTHTVVKTVTVSHTVTVTAPPSGDQRLYGQIRTMEATSGGYFVHFDPAWFLTGITANAAQAEDQGVTCAPRECEAVPNDNLVVDESDRTYVYFLPAAVHGTVLTKTSNNFAETDVTAAQLAGIVDGTSSLQLFEPLESGVWLTVHIDTIRSFTQQYQP
jgi:hypothetical protein